MRDNGGENVERRVVRLAELRVEGDGEGPARILGHAAVFGAQSEDLGGFYEVIEPGFFRDAVGDDVRGLWNHNDDLVLGRTASGTLRVQEDDVGLAIEIEPPATTWARDAMVTMGRGDVDQMSFAFQVREGGDRWEQRDDGSVLRTLLPGGCGRLWDVSPVTFPAYPQTSVAVRARVEGLNAPGTGAGAEEDGDDDGDAGAGVPSGAGGDAEPQGRPDVLRRRLDLAGV